MITGLTQKTKPESIPADDQPSQTKPPPSRDGLLGVWRRFHRRLRRARRRAQGPAFRRFLETRYRRLFDGVPMALYLSAPDGTILDANPSLVQLLRYPDKETLLKRNAYELFVDRSIRVRWMEQVEQHEAVRNYEVQLRRYDGGVIWALDHVRAVRDARGRVMFYEGALQDITERKLAGEELQHLNEKLQAVIEASPLAIISADVEGRVTSWNPAAERTFGWSKAEVIGHPLPIVPEPGRPQHDQLRQQVMRGERLEEIEVQQLKRDGTVIHASLSVAPLRDANGAIVGMLAIVADITERKRVAETRRRLAEILEATPDFVGIATIDGRVAYLNPAGRKLLGIGPTESVAPRPIWDHNPEPYRSLIRDEALPTAIRQGTWNGEVAFLTSDGRQVPTSLLMITHRTPDGRPDHLSIVARDLTEQKALEKRLRQAQTMDAIGRLAGGIAHDFNNLLTSIIGHCDLLLADLSEERSRADVQEIREAGQRAAGLTNQLLAFSRRRVGQPRLLDLNAVIAKLRDRIEETTGEKIELVTALGERLDLIKTDPVQLKEIIISLVENACEAMPDGGRLTVETASRVLTAEQAYEIGIPGPGGCTVLAIRDTGCGMEEATKALIFEPFFSTKKEVKGTGLGLATVYGIVKQSGGEIWVDSEPGSGTTFRIYFPAVQSPAEVPATTPRPTYSTDRGGATILLVEDEAAVLALAARVLRARGCQVLEARDGLEALSVQQAHGAPIDLLITDVVMPRLGGPDLAKRLRESQPELRVVYMSGYTDNKVVRDLRADEYQHFLQKPFTPSALIEMARQAMAKPARR